MNKKLIDITIYIIFIAIILLLMFSFTDVLANNNHINPTYKEWNVIVKWIEWAVNR